MEDTLTSYVHDHYGKQGSSTVYGVDNKDGTMTIIVCMESHQYNPKNYWLY